MLCLDAIENAMTGKYGECYVRSPWIMLSGRHGECCLVAMENTIYRLQYMENATCCQHGDTPPVYYCRRSDWIYRRLRRTGRPLSPH